MYSKRETQSNINEAFVDHNTMRLRSGTVICNVFSRNPPNTVYNHPLNRQCKPVKQSLTIELLKIDDADYYMEACTKYNKGVKEGWTDEQLFDMVTEIRRRPSKNEWEDECLL
jgi:hypothetical protein